MRYGILNPAPQTWGPPAPEAPSYTTGTFGLAKPAGNVTSGASINGEGAWTSLGVVSGNIDVLVLRLTGTVARSHNSDIRLGGSTVVVTDLPFYQGTLWSELRIPIHIAFGQLVEMRTASSGANSVLTVYPYGIQSSPAETAALVEPIGPVPAAVRQSGVSVPVATSPTWVPVGSALTNAIKGLLVNVGDDNDTLRTASDYELEIGTGPDVGSVTALPKIPLGSTSSAITGERIGRILQSFPVGTLFWVRITALTAPTGTDTCNVQIHGIR